MKSFEYSRPVKGNHLATIQYEIDMLVFCYESLVSNIGKWGDIGNAIVCLESFLLHYRNLIEFFGGEGDLKASEPDVWTQRKLTQDEVNLISDRTLCNKYRGPISAYLQHCTKKRADVDRSWNVWEMYKEIEPLIAKFRCLFPAPQAGLRRRTAPSTDTIPLAARSGQGAPDDSGD